MSLSSVPVSDLGTSLFSALPTYSLEKDKKSTKNERSRFPKTKKTGKWTLKKSGKKDIPRSLKVDLAYTRATMGIINIRSVKK